MEISDFSGRNIIILYIAVFKYSTTQQKCNAFLYIKVKKKNFTLLETESKKRRRKNMERKTDGCSSYVLILPIPGQ